MKRRGFLQALLAVPAAPTIAALPVPEAGVNIVVNDVPRPDLSAQLNKIHRASQRYCWNDELQPWWDAQMRFYEGRKR